MSTEDSRGAATETTQGEHQDEQHANVTQRREHAERSVTDIITHPTSKKYLKFITSIYAVIGASIGVAAILIGTFGEPVIFSQEISQEMVDASTEEVSEFETYLSTQYSTAVSGFFLFALCSLTVVLGAGVGGFVGTRFSEFRPAAIISGVSSVTGSAVAIVLGGLLLSTQMAAPNADMFDSRLFSEQVDLVFFRLIGGSPTLGYDLMILPLIITAVLVGIGAAAAAVGTVYVLNNTNELPTSLSTE